MQTRDQVIGRNIARLRGDVTQTQLAERMSSRGWKWSQSTVWSVESGKRPLRYAEAVDVCWILDVEMKDLEGGEDDIDVVFTIGRYYAEIDQVRDAVRKAAEWQWIVAERADQRPGAPLDNERAERIMESFEGSSIGLAVWQVMTGQIDVRTRELAEVDADSRRVRTALVRAWQVGVGDLEVPDGEHQEEA